MPMNLLLRDPAAKGCRRGDHELSQIASSRAPVTLLAAKNAKLNLELGFTTARDLSSGGTADVDLRNAINEGIIPGAADGNSDGRCTLRSDRGRDAVTLADERARQQGTRIPT
jgi:hypothetical protein